MFNNTIKAMLKTDIRKQKKVLAGEVDWNSSYYSFCHLFHGACYFCPVGKHTQRYLCQDSPRAHWIEHQKEEHGVDGCHFVVQCDTCRELAQKELEFLELLYSELL